MINYLFYIFQILDATFVRFRCRLDVLKQKPNANNDLRILMDDIKKFQAECYEDCHEKSGILFAVACLWHQTLKEIK